MPAPLSLPPLDPHQSDAKCPNQLKNPQNILAIKFPPCNSKVFVSIVNQFTNTSTFVSNGKIITIDTNNPKISGE